MLMDMIRDATSDDLPALVRLLGQLNETAWPGAHRAASRRVRGCGRRRAAAALVVERDGAVVGTAVLVIVPNLGHDGAPYALIENVVVDEAARGAGHGERLLRYMIDEARAAGCYKVVLTSRKSRQDAHRFYERIGFTATSEGFRHTLIPG